MLSYNNHYKYFWDDREVYFPERNTYKISFGKSNLDNLSFRDACIYNSKLIGQLYNRPNLFLSGGLDSQAACISFVLANVPVNIKIFKYQDKINSFDVDRAIQLCTQYSLEYEIIDIDIMKFLNNELFYYADEFKSGCLHYSLISKLLYEFKNDINIFGLGDFDFNFSYKRKIYYCYEYEYLGRLSLLHNNYITFFRFSPEIIKAWLTAPEVVDFVLDTHGRIWDECKNLLFKSHFPEMYARKKYTGYEPIKWLVDNLTIDLWNKNEKFIIRRPYTYNNYLRMII